MITFNLLKMKCKKCNSEIPEGARFCPNCGYDTAKRDSQVNKSEETLPIQVFFDSFAKHKKIYISIIVFIIASCVGVYFYSDYQKKKEAERELMSIFESYAKLIGFYYTRDYNTTLSLNANNTVLLSCNGSSYRGYWRDKGDGRPVELEFSETVKIRFGYEEEYHSSLYFYNNALWPSLSAIRSCDYDKCIDLTKSK